MSATNRGAKRHADDFYRTPAWCVSALLEVADETVLWCGSVLDPACGDGAILDVLSDRGASTVGMELDIERASVSSIKHLVLNANSLSEEWPRCDAIVMNPPFVLAQEFVEKAVATVVPVYALLRLGFLAGAKRRKFLRRHPPSSLYVLSSRPSFTGDGKTDAADYAWFAWNLPTHMDTAPFVFLSKPVDNPPG